MKKHLFTALIAIYCCTCFSQVQLYLSDSPLDEYAEYGLTDKNEHYFLNSKGIFDTDVPLLLRHTEGYSINLIKLDDNFDILDSVTIDPVVNYVMRGIQMKMDDDTLYILGRAFVAENHLNSGRVFMARLLKDLTIIDTQIIGIGELPLLFHSFICNHKGQIVVSAVSNYEYDGWGDFTYLVIDKNGSLLHHSTDTTFRNIYTISLQLPISKKYIFNDRYYTRIYDSSFNLLNHYFPDYSPNFFQFRAQSDNYVDDTYFIGGMGVEEELVEEKPEEIAYYRVDTAHNRIDSGMIHFTQKIDYCEGLDFSPPNTLCYGGTHDWDYYGYPIGFQKSFQSITAKSVNTDTNTENWFFNYGGDACYAMYGLYVTPEKECVIYATRYDWLNTDELEHDILLLKIDSTGILVNEKEISFGNDLVIFPNPGTSTIHINSASTAQFCKFELIDLQGKAIYSEKINKYKHSISVSSLPKGIYIYRLTENTGIVRTGKWIKK